MCGIEWTAGNVALLGWALVALVIWCMSMSAIIKAAWWLLTQKAQPEEGRDIFMPRYDGRNGNGYQPEAGQDKPVNPPPRAP